MEDKINWFGLAGGISVIALVVISFFVPWWRLTVGDDLVTTDASPVNTNFSFVGDSLTIPLIMALNIASVIFLTAGGVVMLIYSIKPFNSHSKKLLNFGYRKPLYSVLLFVVGLFLITVVVRSLYNIDVPLSGSISSTLLAEMTQGVDVRVTMNSGFQWPFLLANITAILCIIARLYHNKITSTSTTSHTSCTI